jgi:hypothetical protein
MARMIKKPGGVQHKYKDIKQKFTAVKVENEATISRAKHLEEMTQDIKKVPSEDKLQSRNKVVKLSRSDRQPPRRVIGEAPQVSSMFKDIEKFIMKEVTDK